MSRAWEIPGWNTGAWIKRDCLVVPWRFYDGHWEFLENGKVVSGSAQPQNLHQTDWSAWSEPPKTRKVKMYAPIRKMKTMKGDVYFMSAYESQKVESSHIHPLVGWHEIEVTIEGE